jgi:eukaryotic-like serine/threonine-protein kinase
MDISYTGPIVVNGVVYFASTDDFLYALDARSGAKLWSYKTGNIIDSSPTVVDRIVYFGSGGTLYALNARSGSELWSYKVGGNITSSPAVISGIVYFGSLYQYYDHHNTDFYALDARSGSKLWSFQTRGSSFQSGFSSGVHSSPAVVNGVVYFGSEDNSQLLKNSDFAFMGSGILFALDTHSGSKLWSFQTGREINSSPVVVNGVVYFGSLDGRLYAFYLESK